MNAIIFSMYMIGEVYCENRSHPEIILFIRRISAIRITESGPCFPSAIYLPVGISNFWERLILRYTSQLVLVQIYIHIMLCMYVHTYINAFCAQRLYFGDVHIILHILLLMNAQKKSLFSLCNCEQYFICRCKRCKILRDKRYKMLNKIKDFTSVRTYDDTW